MNRRMVAQTVGRILLSESALLLLPLAVAIIYKENCVSAFLITALVSLVLGLILSLCFKPVNKVIYAKEGFVTVSVAWIALSAVGCLPFVISGAIPNFIDALFETVSGFTTTGATIISDVERLSHGILFWRSFTHWVGGMGILVFVMAIIPNMSDRSIHIMRAEMPGPIVGKLVPKAKDTAKILYLLYIGITAAEMIILIIEGMPAFHSILLSFGTAGTGGFGVLNSSIGDYPAVQQYTIAIFMLLFGVNFNLYFLVLVGKLKDAIKSTELWVYLGIVASVITAITLNLTLSSKLYSTFGDIFRVSFFETAAIITTTGYSVADFNIWPMFSKGIILILMFFGGCAGSTAGGFKISRLMLLMKVVRRELKVLVHPRSVINIKLEGKTVEETVIRNLCAYFAIYVCCFVVIFILIAGNSPDIQTGFSAAASCFNNVGPGFGAIASNYCCYNAFSKLVLTAAMLLGRLEIFPLIVSFSPSTWTRR